MTNSLKKKEAFRFPSPLMASPRYRIRFHFVHAGVTHETFRLYDEPPDPDTLKRDSTAWTLEYQKNAIKALEDQYMSTNNANLKRKLLARINAWKFGNAPV